jgi:hypothetical protein
MIPEYHNRGLGVDLLDREYPYAVDIPIPLRGLGDKLPLILDAAQSCSDRAQVWSHSKPAPGPSAGELRTWWSRIGTKSAPDARRLVKTFRSLGARRVR